MTATATLEIQGAKRIERQAPTWKNGGWTVTHREYTKKPRMYFSVEGETILENLAYRFDRPSRLYKSALGEALRALDLPEDTKAVWSQTAGCSCGCSPGFVLTHDALAFDRGDYFVTVGAAAEAKVSEDADRWGIQARMAALFSDPTLGPILAPDYQAEPEGETMTGRGPQGNLRNFRQMRDQKLLNILATVRAEANDSGAIAAAEAEARDRGLLA